MKPSRFAAFARNTSLFAFACLTIDSAAALNIYWDGSAGVLTDAVPGPPIIPAFNTGAWGDSENWSTDSLPNTNGQVPGGSDIVNFAATGVTTAQVIQLGQTRSALGLKSVAGLSTSLRGGGAPQTLLLGTSGLDHTFGGMVIGSSADAAAQAVDVSLQGSQTWLSSVVSGSPAAVAISVQNTVSLGVPGNHTLTLTGNNSGSVIQGAITDGAGVLAINKTGTATSVWTLSGTGSNFSGGITITNGILAINNPGTFGTVSVGTAGSPGTVGTLRLGPGFTSALIAPFANAATYTTGSILSINNPTATIATGLTGNFALTKMGTNTLTLTAANTYTGKTIVDAGNLVVTTLAGLPSLGLTGNQVNGTGQLTLATGGLTGFSPANLTQLLANTTFAATTGAILGLDTTAGDFAWSGGLSGAAVRLTKTAGTTSLVLTGPSTYTGTTSISAGAISVPSLSAIGSGNVNLGSGGNGGRLRYNGPNDTTPRVFNLNGTTGGGVIEANGALFINSNLTATGLGNKILTLTGTANGSVIGGIVNSTGFTTTVVKNGSGSWTINGTAGYTGTSTVNGGTLILDYSGTANTVDPVNGASYNIQSGHLLIQGKSADGGPTSDTIATLQFGGSAQYGNPRFTVSPNDGPGVQLTISTLSTGGNNQHHSIIDLSSSTGNSVTVGALTNLIFEKGIIMDPGSGGNGGRAALVLHDQNGIHSFASLSGAGTGTLQGIPAETYIAPAAGAITFGDALSHYRLGGGAYTTSGGALFTTVTFDSTSAPVSLDLGPAEVNTNTFSPTVSGRGVLFTGGNDVTISGGATGGIASNGALWMHNYLTPAAALNLTASYGIGQAWIFGGTGYTNYSGLGMGTYFIQDGGLFRVSTPQVPIALKVTSGGVFEIGADLNGAATGDFSLAVSSTGILLYNDSGLSAAGANRVVDFTSAAVSQALTWGSGAFLTNYDGAADGDYAFKLSSSRSDATIEIKNSINLNGRSRTVEVANGSADVDAVLSGVLSGSLASDLVKTGPGVLALTGANTYLGETRVVQGVLKIGAGSLASASRLRIEVGASVNVTGTVYLSAVTLDGVAQAPGPIAAGPFITGGGTIIVGPPPINSPYDQWVIDKSLAGGDAAPEFDFDKDGLRNLIEYAVGTEPKFATASVLASVPGAPNTVRFNQASGRTDITFVVEASADLNNPWTVIATSTAGGAFTGIANVDVSTSSGVVTVTDNRTPAPTKSFYRLRATK